MSHEPPPDDASLERVRAAVSARKTVQGLVDRLRQVFEHTDALQLCVRRAERAQPERRLDTATRSRLAAEHSGGELLPPPPADRWKAVSCCQRELQQAAKAAQRAIPGVADSVGPILDVPARQWTSHLKRDLESLAGTMLAGAMTSEGYATRVAPIVDALQQRYSILLHGDLQDDEGPADEGPAEDEDVSSMASVTPAQARAAASYEWASKQRPDLIPEGQRYSRELWKFVRNEECLAYRADDGSPVSVPDFETWKRQVRAGQQILSDPKTSTRAGRGHGGSIVHSDEI